MSLRTCSTLTAIGGASPRVERVRSASSTSLVVAIFVILVWSSVQADGSSVDGFSQESPTQVRERNLPNLVSQRRGPDEKPLAPREKISLSTKDADLVEVLRTFAKLADINLVVDPGIDGTVTVELREVAWEDALAVILRSSGLAAEVDGRVWRVR